MKILLTFSIFIILLLSTIDSYAQGPNPSRSITQFVDPIKKHLWSRIDLAIISRERNGYHRSRYRANLVVLKKGIEDKDYYTLRFHMQTNLRDFPIKSEAYLMLNSITYPIQLKEVRSASYHVEEETQRIDTSGIFIQEMSTSSFQLFRKEADITVPMNDLTQIEKAVLIIYTGDMPIVFNLDSYNCKKLELILDY